MKSILPVISFALLCAPFISNAQCPTPNLGNDTAICEGSSLLLDAGNPGATYLWSTGATTQTISVTDEGDYDVTITQNTCSISDNISISFKPSLWSDFVGLQVSDCLPVKFRFTDKSYSCDAPIVGWFWEFPDGTTSTEQNPEHEFSAAGQQAIKLTVTDNNGNSLRRSKKVNVVPTSVPVIVDLGLDTTICFGSSVTLDAGNSGATYVWNTGEVSQQITVFDDGNYSVQIDKNGCKAKDTVQVNTAASVTTKWGSINSGTCLPVSVSFTDSSQAYCGQTINEWQWDFGDGYFSSEQNPQHIYYSADSFVVKLTVTTSNGTEASRLGRVVVTNDTFTLDIPSEIKVCPGTTVQLDAAVADAEFLWSPATGVSETTIRNPSVLTPFSAWYMVDVKKCMVEKRDSVYIFVDTLGQPKIIQSGNLLRTGDAAGYEWYRDGQRINGVDGNSLRIERQGFYTVKISNALGCQRSSDQVFFMPKSDDEDNGLVIKCSPNPTNGQFSVIMSQVLQRPAKLAVYDRFGRVLATASIRDNVNPMTMLKLSKGMYFVNITVDNKRKIIPVIVQ